MTHFPILAAFHQAGEAFKAVIHAHAVVTDSIQMREPYSSAYAVRESMRMNYLMHRANPMGLVSRDIMYHALLASSIEKWDTHNLEALVYDAKLSRAIRMAMDSFK